MEDLRHHVHRPEAHLSLYVREILVMRSAMPREQVLLPEPGATIAFWVSGGATVEGEAMPAAVISGLQSHQRIANHTADTTMLVVRFTPTGAAAFLHDRGDLLYRQTFPLDEVLGAKDVNLALEQLREAGTRTAQVSALERILARRIKNGIEVSAQIRAATSLLAESRGRIRIPVVAKRVAMSERVLERGFRSIVGASPKHVARLFRLQQVCDLWDAGASCTEIAHSVGYTDQSHFVHDFKNLSGSSPSVFLKRASPRNLPVFYK